MPKPEPGTVIAYMDCPDCGTPDKPIKLNKNGVAYYDCREVIDPATGERCFCRRSWGRKKSAEMIHQYEVENAGTENQNGPEGRRLEAANDNEPESGQGGDGSAPANDNAAEPEREPGASGDGGALSIFGWGGES